MKTIVVVVYMLHELRKFRDAFSAEWAQIQEAENDRYKAQYRQIQSDLKAEMNRKFAENLRNHFDDFITALTIQHRRHSIDCMNAQFEMIDPIKTKQKEDEDKSFYYMWAKLYRKAWVIWYRREHKYLFWEDPYFRETELHWEYIEFLHKDWDWESIEYSPEQLGYWPEKLSIPNMEFWPPDMEFWQELNRKFGEEFDRQQNELKSQLPEPKYVTCGSLGPTASLERRDEQERELATDSFSFWKNAPKSDREEMEFWLDWSSFFDLHWKEKQKKEADEHRNRRFRLKRKKRELAERLVKKYQIKIILYITIKNK